MRFQKSSEKPSREAEGYEGLRWEYRARNLKKVAGMMIEKDFNEHGAAGWEFVAMSEDYAVFKRPITDSAVAVEP